MITGGSSLDDNARTLTPVGCVGPDCHHGWSSGWKGRVDP